METIKSLLLTLVLLLCAQFASAQTIDIKGIVTDDAGMPIVGATIAVKGATGVGTISDLDGQFSLKKVSTSATISVTYIGYITQELKPKANMKIKLEQDNTELDEVIVTAFGTAKRSAFTGSAAVLSSKDIEKKQVTNVMQSLIGEVPGMSVTPSTSPGGTSTLLVRGKGSINADTDPLIVLDGIPYNGGINNINPQDVESVTVLKDAASSALYGARGANGVIMITTKKGSAGKAKVNVDARWGFNQRSTQDYDRITNPGEYYELHYKALYNSYISDGSSAAEAHKKANENMFGDSSNGGLGYNVYTVPNNEYLIGTNGKLNPNATLGRRIYRNGEVYTLMPDDWTEETYRTGFRQEYNVNISGGNTTSTTYASFGYLQNEGIVASSDYERYSGRLRSTYNVNKWLSFGANAGYSHSVNRYAYSLGYNGSYSYSTGGVFSDAANVGPIYPLYVRDINGNKITNSHGTLYDWGEGTYNEDGRQRPPLSNSSSLNSLDLDYYETVADAFNTDAYADVNLPAGFKFTFKMGLNLHERKESSAYNPYYGWDSSNGGSLTINNERTTTLNLQQLLNWTRSFGKHNISAMIGHESYKYKYDYIFGSKRGAVDYENNHELYGYLDFAATPTGSYQTNYNTEGYLFRAMYDYAERYYAQGSFRRDASSKFHPDHRWGNFWSLGGAWIVSKEAWFNAKWVNNLKLKASYGQVGNDNISSYSYTDKYSASNSDGQLALSFYSKGNKDITWETVSNFNVGFEFGLFKNRLSGSLEYYNKTTTDMLLWFSTPNTLGYSGYYKNVGDMRNQGIEVVLNGTPIRKKNFEWGLSLNFAYSDQEVTYIPDSNKSMVVDGYEGFQSGNDYFYGEGLPLSVYYIAKYAGVSEEGKSLWYYTDKDGSLKTTDSYTSADFYIVDNYVPMKGSFSTTLRYHNFDLGVQFVYAIGGKGYDAEYAQLMTVPSSGATGYAVHKDALKAWSEDNPTSDIPRWQFGDTYTGIISDRFLISKTYLSFQNFQIGYNVPKRLMSKTGITKTRLYVSGDNLYLWSKRKGYDPRLASGYGSYSPMRAISGGINIQF